MGEISYHVLTLLNTLSAISSWCEAIKIVLKGILSGSAAVVSAPALWSSLKGLETLGASVFLGEISGGPYLGATAVSHYSVGTCRVLSIHKAMSVAIVLGLDSSLSKTQLSTVRLSDLSSFPLQPPFELDYTLLSGCIDLLDSLKGSAVAAVSDLMCALKPEHPYLRNVLLRILRPTEIFVFHHILRCLARSGSGLNSVSELLRGKHELFLFILQSCARTHSLPTLNSKGLPGLLHQSGYSLSIPRLWASNAMFVSSIPNTVTTIDYPAENFDRTFLVRTGESSGECSGVEVDRLEGVQGALIQRGMLPELIISNSSSDEKRSDLCAASFLGSKGTIPSTEWGSASPTGCSLSTSIAHLFGSPGCVSTSLLTAVGVKTTDELDASANALKLMMALRMSIINSSRQLITDHNILDAAIFRSLSMPWKLLMWFSFANRFSSSTTSTSTLIPSPHRQDVSPLTSHNPSDQEGVCCISGDSNHALHALQGAITVRGVGSSLLTVMLSDLSKTYEDVTESIAANLRFYLLSVRSTDDSLDTCDLLKKLLCSAQAWLRAHEDKDSEPDVCFRFLTVLLPSLAKVQNLETSQALVKVRTSQL